MKKKYIPLVILGVSLLSFQCTDPKSTSMTDQSNQQTESSEEPILQEVEVIQGYQPEATDAFDVISAGVKGDILTLVVSYGGGCEDHEFNLIFNGAYKKSLPPQIDLFLKHNANGDKCRAMVQQELKFDIAAVKGSNKSVVISLNNFKEKIQY